MNSGKIFNTYLTLFVITLLFLVSMPTEAMVTLDEFIEDMVTRHQFDRSELTNLFNQVEIKKSVLRAMDKGRPRPNAKGTPWYRYRRNFITSERIEGGVAFRRQYARTLERAEATYGVPAEIIVAIIGVETHYGRNTGGFRVMDALTTIAFYYPRRADYFREELEHFLLLCREEKINPLLEEGSYAGAMGLGQFMPSSFRKYAVDFDGDGKRDIWNNVDDAIGSVANYFRQFGWQNGQPVMLATQIQPDSISSLLAMEAKPQYTVKQLKQQGILFQGEHEDDLPGIVVELETEQGKAYWIGFQNFYVITRYNRSFFYATSVYQLAQRIADEYLQNL